MKNENLLKVGVIGTIVTALCCFTPVLVILFGFIGLSAWVSSLDYVLFPALFLFLVMSTFAAVRHFRNSQNTNTN